MHPSDPGADRGPTQPGGGQQADQLGGLPEGELCGHPGALPQQPGEVPHRLGGPQHHVQPPQAGERRCRAEDSNILLLTNMNNIKRIVFINYNLIII